MQLNAKNLKFIVNVLDDLLSYSLWRETKLLWFLFNKIYVYLIKSDTGHLKKILEENPQEILYVLESDFFFAILEKPLLHQFILLEKNTTLELSIIALNMETKWMSSAFLMALLSLNAVIQGKIHL